jgi:metallo-beta-lactamase family protein
MIKMAFHGAAQTVTGSQHLLEINGYRILLDCGLYQGRRAEAKEKNSHFPYDPRSLDAVILSHAHIDHSGNLPQLVKKGYTGPIICTPPTRDLCVSMLQDSGFIQEKDAEFFNQKLRKKGEPAVEPLYTKADAIAAIKHFTPIPYEFRHSVLPGVELVFLDAGHILGSAITILEWEEVPEGRRRLVFSGDLGRDVLPIIRAPQLVDFADILIMESTYGDRTHPAETDTESQLAEVIIRTAKRGGAVVIPAFAVGRTQQLVYTFQKLVSQGRIPHIPIYVDSPLATDVTATFRAHPDVYDEDIQAYMTTYGDRDPFGFESLSYTRDVEESKALNEKTDPFIVISASGMCEAGRVLHHLRNRIEESKNTLLFVGWQSPDTLGRRILDSRQGGPREVKIFGQPHTIRAEVVALDGLSGHADQDEMLSWAAAMYGKPAQTFLVHGEVGPAEHLAGRLRAEAGLPSVTIPAPHQVFEL